MHEEKFWSNWLRQDERSKEEMKIEAEGKGEKVKEKRGKERRRKKGSLCNFLSRGRCGELRRCFLRRPRGQS